MEERSDINKKYKIDKYGKKGVRAGQAVIDILSKDQQEQTVEETISAFGPDFVKDFEKCVDDNRHKYKSPFHVLVLSKKEMWAVNLVRNFFIARQTAPRSCDMVLDYPNHTKTLYKVDAEKGKVELLWSIPGHQDCMSICKTPESFDPELFKWIKEAYSSIFSR